MPFSLGQLLLKVAPGVIVIVIIGGFGFYFGMKVKQGEVDKLQAQLAEYQSLGQRVTDLKAAIDESIKEKNQALIEAYEREIDKVRTDFGQARTGLAEATAALKRGGVSIKNSTASLATTIGKLPVGSPEREAKVMEALSIMSDQNKLQQLCTVTSIADAQLIKLKTSYSMGIP
ncbi:hypothetical protein B2J86_08160 [Acidovorax sp. SRB_14]|uniref:hypothetical protein n=1 Tax=Acidovorax sp. SRB_14 TaxID=1962699 RepID=UPI001564E2CF|nr:hypothetical protein [Acidovorax sp. SRB_14]NMM80898.1 hypothetical protein [Acidovorax sp. SRB_14]